MTEIKLQLDDPAEFARYARAHASQIPGAWRGRADQYLSIAEQIEEQVKPAALEPIAFGSAVLAFVCGNDPMQWVRTSPPEYSQWTNRDGYTVPWQKLCEVEVLRVGIGEASGEDYRDGFSEAKFAMGQQLRNLRAEALTAERQNAYDKAIAVVKEIS